MKVYTKEPVKKPDVVIELDEFEAETLHAVLGCIGGCGLRARVVVDLLHSLTNLGVRRDIKALHMTSGDKRATIKFSDDC